MPMKMISEIPFPMPRSVICSPSHITKIVPDVRVRMVSSRKAIPPDGTTLAVVPLPTPTVRLSRNMLIPYAWITERITVP